MWKKGTKRKAGETESSDAGDAKPTKNGKAESSDKDDGIGLVFELSKNRKVSVKTLGDKILVDIREFYTKDGNTLPGKKGISLPLDQWNILKEHMSEIDHAIKEES
ncbi:RNA polymerase II transcriptional coactivator [Zostera marina]|uniref:RNA polymerase II transcriptional coactivator n=1 Tax=Zostera marina TaxID=29655 RepID=A0A0K9PX86_ZOSMR|nr:RNA polymerase II transcriptional coactivator [Zostera marina]